MDAPNRRLKQSMLTCTMCKKTKDAKEFYHHPETTTGYQSRCKECNTASAKKSRALKDRCRTVILGVNIHPGGEIHVVSSSRPEYIPEGKYYTDASKLTPFEERVYPLLQKAGYTSGFLGFIGGYKDGCKEEDVLHAMDLAIKSDVPPSEQ